jgi:hypothetical protein
VSNKPLHGEIIKLPGMANTCYRERGGPSGSAPAHARDRAPNACRQYERKCLARSSEIVETPE